MSNEMRVHFKFDTGVERIIDGTEMSQLPQSRELLPADIVVQQQLSDLLYAPTWDQELQRALKPSFQHGELLTPSRFQTVLDDTRRMLDSAVQQAESGDGRQALQAAASLLQEQQGLRDVLNTYRHLLHKA